MDAENVRQKGWVDLKIGLTQMNPEWEDKQTNRMRAEELIGQASKRGVELLIFPEMTLTGFSMQAEQIGEELLFSPTLQFFKQASVRYKMAIAFGFVEDFGGEYYNKCMIVDRGKILYDYDKIHPFSYGEEGEHYIGGHEVKTAYCRGMTVAGFVCYDLRFPEIFQAVSDTAELIFVIANWPKERIAHWKALLCARAIENQCYVVGVNRTGRGNGLEYVESSMAFDPLGNCMTGEGEKAPLYVIEAEPETVAGIRQKYPFKKDRQPELYQSFYTAQTTDP